MLIHNDFKLNSKEKWALFIELMKKQSKILGLTTAEVKSSKLKNGTNSLKQHQKNSFWAALITVFKDPMFLLLFIAAAIYFLMGKYNDGIFMSFAIFIIASIALFQITKSKNAIKTLEKLSQPKNKVHRNGELIEISAEEIVLGDVIQIEEGQFIPADAQIINSFDFSVNESILTGEAFSVLKDEKTGTNEVFQGTIAAGGMAICVVSAIGTQTRIGKIGKSINEIEIEKTPLQLQIEKIVKKISVLGVLLFVIVWGVNFYHTKIFFDSLIKAMTIAMSIIPEEIPVAFTTFMALGAWRLLKEGVVVKNTNTIETLGSATVICTDKTGTITENKMSIAQVYIHATNQILNLKEIKNSAGIELISTAMWASEALPFDTMERAIHKAYSNLAIIDERSNFKLIYEYPLNGKPPMMTQIFENNSKNRIIASKGAPEAIISCSELTKKDIQNIQEALKLMYNEGFRVLAVAKTTVKGKDFPKNQQDFKFHFMGLVAFYDPPKKNIKEVFHSFYKAGIDIKIITGDHAETTTSIAKQIGFKNYKNAISGDELMAMSSKKLKSIVMKTHLFTRMFPEAKLKIIEALKGNHQIVAMTGDGVNDGPALKAAHIGISMGKSGSEIAKQAANLILIEDDFAKMVDAIAMGRKIYINLKKAILFIISIHIPIILIVFIPLACNWIYPSIFSPIHVIFLELILGPTCSIIYENEPMEKNLMNFKPRPITVTFFQFKEIILSVIQGLIITLGLLLIYQYSIAIGDTENQTRTSVFICLVCSNIFLTLTNRSFYYSIFTTIKYKNNLVFLIIGLTVSLTLLLLYVPKITLFFQFGILPLKQIGICILVSSIAVFWVEGLKFFLRKK